MISLVEATIFVFDLQRFGSRTMQTEESQLAARREVDYDPEIARYMATVAPLTILTRQLAKKKVTDSKFAWFEEDIAPNKDAINNAAGYLAGDTDLVVDHAAYFTVYDVVKIERTGEQILVTAINDATETLTVTRAFGTTAAAAINDNDVLFIVGNAHAEAGARGGLNLNNPSEVTNYTQIFKHSFGVSNTEKAAKQKGVKEFDRLRLDKLLEHNRAIETQLIFGEPNADTSAARRTTGGVLYFNSVNSKDFGGATTLAEVEDGMQTAFTEGSNTKVLLAAPTVVSVIDQLAQGKLETVPSDKTFGIAVKRLISSHGELLIIKHRMLTGTVYGNYGILLDMKYLKYAYLRDTKEEPNIQDNGTDGQINQFITECGLEMKLPKAHMLWTNITSAA